MYFRTANNMVYVKADIPPGFLEGSLYKNTLYHGTNNTNVTQLKPEGGAEYGIYLTPRHKYARMYGDHLYRVLVNIQKPLFVADKSEISPRDLTRRDVEELKVQGYDSIVSGNSEDIATAHEVILFDKEQAHVLEN